MFAVKMYDDVTISNIPRKAKRIACYVDGLYANYAEAKRLRPGAKLKSITVNGSSDADIGDVETGDMTPASGARWAHSEIIRHPGKRPIIYCNLSTWPAVMRAVRAEGIAEKVDYWIAHYDGSRRIPKGAIGKQYLGYPGNSPGPYDVSVVHRRLFDKKRMARWLRRRAK